MRQWTAEEIRTNRGDAQSAEAQLGEQLDTFLAAVQDDSHIWVTQPVDNSQSTERLTVLALPRHWLRLEQVAAALSDTPSAQLIDTSLRMDGAPVLLLDNTHLRQQRDPARKFTLALMFHPSRDQFVMLIQSSPASITENRAFLQTVIQSILFE